MGVLRVLEEMRVPVDLVAGTSMGALIGGAYASGMTVDEIESLLARMDWDELFSAAPRRQDLTFRRKEDSRRFSMDLEIGFDGQRFGLPTSFIGQHGLNLLIKTLTLPVAEIRDFDLLPIPFRAVAADVGNGDVVVLGQGELSRAMLASMSIPGVFEPVGIEGRLLVDGGMVRNVPVDVVRDMGADIVIAVDVGTPLVEAMELRDALSVVNQTTGIMVQTNSRLSREELGPDDVLIVPELGAYSAADFPNLMSTIPIGTEAARAKADALERLAVDGATFAPYLARTVPRETSLTVDTVEVINQTGLSDAVIRSLLEIQAGQTLEMAELHESLTRLQGAGDFQKVDFRVEHRDGRVALVVIPLDKLWGPNYFRFGVSVRDNIETTTTFNMLTRFTMTRLNRRGGEFRAEFQLGETRLVQAEFYQPLDNHLRLFVDTRATLGSQVLPIFQGDAQVATFRSRIGGLGAAVGSRLGLWGQARVGVSWQEHRNDPLVAPEDTPSSDSTQTTLGADLIIDEFDDPWFPSEGVFGGVQYERAVEALGGQVSFDRLEGRLTGAQSWGRSTVLLSGAAGTSLGSDLPFWEQFGLGGFTRLSGLRRRQLAGNYFGFGALAYYRAISQPRGLAPVGGFRVGASLETGNTWDEASNIELGSLRVAGSLFLGFSTLIGPVYLAYGHADGGENSFYFFLGRIF